MRDEILKALKRQTDNMAFLLNHANLPEQWFERFNAELEADRAVIAKTKRPTNTGK